MKKNFLKLFILVFVIAGLAACSPAALSNQIEQAVSQVAALAELPESTAEAAVQVTPEAEGTLQRAANSSLQVTPTELQENLIQVYRQTNPGVVFILTSLGSGSGFVYSQDGYIVTNNHVVEGGSNFEVVFYNGERREASLVGTDADSDLAVLQVDSLPESAAVLPLAQPEDLQVGELVIAIGNPFGEQGSMSLGIVSGLGRSLPSQRAAIGQSTYSLPQVIQTDAPINPGNSGGPLLNLNGEVVGVNAAIATASGTNSGVGFSIPIEAVRLVVPELINEGEYNYAYMGASFDGELTLTDQERYDLPTYFGAYVVTVTDGSPADEAGLQAANPQTGQDGDLIIAIDGQPVEDFNDLNSYLVFNTTIGDTVELTVLRNGQEVSVPLTLGARP